MSGILEHAMRLEEYGLRTVPNKQVCAKHFSEKPIQDFINNRMTKGRCDYCGSERSVRDLEDVMIQIMKTVMFFYTDPANYMSYESAEGGYQDQENIYTAQDIIFEHLGLEIENSKLFADIEQSLDYSAAWSDEYKYLNTHAEVLDYEWDEFKNLVKHKARYLFFEVINERIEKGDAYMSENPLNILNDVGDKIIHYNLVQNLPKGSTFYRCRQHASEEKITIASQICAPKNEFTKNPNRMSPSGISMFYGAFDLKTSTRETLDRNDTSRPVYTYANFNTKNELTVVDFSKLPNEVNIWDAERLPDYYSLKFLHSFVRDLSKPISRDGMEHIEYVPTQIITEYLRYSFGHIHNSGKKIDGVIFPSSRTFNTTNSCVLFFDHEESLENLTFLPESIKRVKIRPSR